MQLLLVGKDRPTRLVEQLDRLPEDGFLWVDAESTDPPATWRDLAQALAATAIFDAHLQDTANETHPSFFDGTSNYELIIFRGLSPVPDARDEAARQSTREVQTQAGPINTQPQRIRTAPMAFFIFHSMLVSIRPQGSAAIDSVRSRLIAGSGRTLSSPADLAHRILNSMVDRYLDLRQPLTDRLDRWQRNLLDPRRPFNDWHALLEQRIEIRKLEHLCEEQRDAIQEWRDYRLEDMTDAMSVKLNDLLEHIARVLNHAQRLEQTAESAVQLHFSATAHRTSEIMRTLTIITAIFMPLTLITGVFGMNFRALPGQDQPWGFWVTLGCMAVVAAVLLLLFRHKRYIDSSERHRR